VPGLRADFKTFDMPEVDQRSHVTLSLFFRPKLWLEASNGLGVRVQYIKRIINSPREGSSFGPFAEKDKWSVRTVHLTQHPLDLVARHSTVRSAALVTRFWTTDGSSVLGFWNTWISEGTEN
jgi:hypothetical protein